jgi:hypothetical protein
MLIEQRGIDFAIAHMIGAGWHLSKDRQRDGVGYDLTFERAGREAHVEVKGVGGPSLRFNLTAKEWLVSESDRDWLLLAVLQALTTGATVVELRREDLEAMQRRVLADRLSE